MQKKSPKNDPNNIVATWLGFYVVQGKPVLTEKYYYFYNIPFDETTEC